MAFGRHDIVALLDDLVMVLLVNGLESAVVGDHVLALRLFSCNIFVVVTIHGGLAWLEHGVGFVTVAKRKLEYRT